MTIPAIEINLYVGRTFLTFKKSGPTLALVSTYMMAKDGLCKVITTAS